MEIMDTRHETPDNYDLKDIYVGYDWSTQDPKYVQRYLTISLEPRIYARNRFEGQSFEKKKHGARQMKFYASEIQKMIDALNVELALCHHILLDHNLIPKLIEAINKGRVKE